MNPCQRVRTTCHRWMNEEELAWEKEGESSEGRRSVKINTEKIAELAHMIAKKQNEAPIEWDEEEWHYVGKNYSGSEAQRKERVALYILALDAINFCFWPNRDSETGHNNKLEYDTLAIALKRMAEEDEGDASTSNVEHHPHTDSTIVSETSYAFSPRVLASLSTEDMRSRIQPYLQDHYLDNMEKRCELWNELGRVLIEKFDSSASNMIAKAGGIAPNLVNEITTNFEGFQDFLVPQDDREEVWFLKRSQIAVGDLNASLKLNLTSMSELTCFADYRVPQVLRDYGILVYSPKLETIVDREKEIQRDSNDEISIRASTVVAVELLVELLRSLHPSQDFTAVKTDWYLWQLGEYMHQKGNLKSFHKVRTHFY